MHLNTLRPRQNCHHLAEDIFKCIFLNQNDAIEITKVPIENKPTMVQIMAWRHPGDRPSSEAKMAFFTDAFMCPPASIG